MILAIIGAALSAYFLGVLAVYIVGTVCLAAMDASEEEFDAAHFLKRYYALQDVAWRWPLVLPVWLATAFGMVVGLVVGRVLRILRRAYRRVFG